MNPTRNDTILRIQAVGDVFRPVGAPRGTVQRRILLTRSAFAYAGLITTLVQIVVWLTIGVVSGHLDTPWWLWTAVPAAVVVVGLTVVDRWRSWWSIAESTAPTSH